jgi:hypothetical protein
MQKWQNLNFRVLIFTAWTKAIKLTVTASHLEWQLETFSTIYCLLITQRKKILSSKPQY